MPGQIILFALIAGSVSGVVTALILYGLFKTMFF